MDIFHLLQVWKCHNEPTTLYFMVVSEIICFVCDGILQSKHLYFFPKIQIFEDFKYFSALKMLEFMFALSIFLNHTHFIHPASKFVLTEASDKSTILKQYGGRE